MTIVLRPYQVEAVRAAWSCLTDGRDPLLVMATGTGKSPVYAEVARRWCALHDTDVVVLAHRRELLSQARRHLREAGVPDDRSHAMSVQSLYGDTPVPGNVGLVVYDEAHHAVSPMNAAVLAKFEDARVMGLTATPDRADGVGLGRVFDEVAYRYDAERAIRDGHLADVRRASASSVRELQLLAGRRRTIVFADSVESSRRIAAALGPTAAHVDGKTPSRARADVMSRFATGQIQFLCNCDLVTEGFDVPTCSVAAVMRRVGSRGMLAQMVGRAMRPAEGKSECLLVQLPDAHALGLVPPYEVLADAERATGRRGGPQRPGSRPGPGRSAAKTGPCEDERTTPGLVGRFWNWLWR